MSQLIQADKRNQSLVLQREPASLPPVNLEAIDLRSIFRLGRRRFWTIILVALCVLIPTGAVTYTTTPLYMSTVTLQIDPEAAKVVPYIDVSAGYVNAPNNFELYMRTKDEILRSPQLHRRTAQHLNQTLDPQVVEAMQDELRSLTSRVQVQRVEGSQIVRVSYGSADPQFAATVVNTLADQFIQVHFEQKSETTAKASKFLEEQLEVHKARIEVAEKELLQYTKLHSLPNSEKGDLNVPQQRYEYLNQQLSQIESTLIVKRAELSELEKISMSEFPEKLRTTAIAGLEAQLFSLEQSLTTALLQFGKNWPEVTKMEEQKSLLETQLNRAKKASISEVRSQLQMEYASAREKYRQLSEAIAREKSAIERLNEAYIQFNILQREIDTNQQLHQVLLQRLKETGVTSHLEFGNIHIVDGGRPSQIPYHPRSMFNLAVGTIIGLTLGIGLAIFFEQLDNKIRTPEQSELLGLPTLGLIPRIEPSANGAGALSLITHETQDRAALVKHSIREAYRSLCASILLSSGDKPPKTIVVTSAAPEEGKTTITACLGRTLAESGARTVIIDCDLRNPSLGGHFGLNGRTGISQFLSGVYEGAFPDLVVTEIPNLFVIPSGPIPPNPVALFASESFTRLLETLRKEFRFVLIDSPPVLGVADTWIMAPKVDGVLMVIKSNEVAGDAVKRATQQIESVGGTILGSILNSVDLESLGPSYYQMAYYSARYGESSSSS